MVGERRARAAGAVLADARVRRGRCRGEATEARGCDMRGARAAEHPNTAPAVPARKPLRRPRRLLQLRLPQQSNLSLTHNDRGCVNRHILYCILLLSIPHLSYVINHEDEFLLKKKSKILAYIKNFLYLCPHIVMCVLCIRKQQP